MQQMLCNVRADALEKTVNTKAETCKRGEIMLTDNEKATRRADERAEMRKAAAQAFPLYLRNVHGLTEQQISGKELLRCLNPQHNDSDASMKYYTDGHLYCFGCGKRYDLPELIADDNGLTISAPETWAIVETWAQHGGFLPRIEDIPISAPDSAAAKEYDQRDYFRRCAANRNDRKFIEYIEKRGITLETAERFNLGYRPKWKPAMQSPLPYTPRIIIPTSDFSYSARYCGDPVPDGIAKVMKKGHIRLFNTAAASRKCALFLCEGEFDAMSIEQHGGAAIALGGVSNKNRFLQAAPKLLKNRTEPLIIALDADPAGKQTAAEILTALHGMRRNKQIPLFKIRLFTAYCGTKDINELHTKSPDRLKAILRNNGGNGEGF